MSDSIGAFTKQFIPAEGGYLYYPSKKEGGKLVTVNEYNQLLNDWTRVVGRGRWKVVGAVVLAIIAWDVLAKSFSLPDWSGSIMVAATVGSLSMWLLWASLAPRRLVRERAAITPPRPISETKRQARALHDWRSIIVGLLLSGIAFLGSLNTPERNFQSSAWLIGSGSTFVLYVWIGIQKFRDR